MDNKIDFDIKSYEELKDYSPIPDNQYILRIKKCEIITTKNSDRVLRLEFVVDSGLHINRVISIFLNIYSENENQREYARKSLRSIGTISGKEEQLSATRDLGLLVGSVVGADVYIDRKMQNPANKIRYFKRPGDVVDQQLSGFAKMADDQVNKKSLSQNSEESSFNDDIPF